MDATEIKQKLKERGLTQNDLARVLGIAQANVSRLLSGKRRLYADELSTIKAFLDGRSSDSVRTPNVEMRSRSLNQERGSRDLPVYASAQGGLLGMIVSYEPVDWIVRPAYLEGVASAFAFYTVGESMRPRFRHGDRLIVHPRRPAGPGDDVLLVLADQSGDSGNRSAMVKELVRIGKDSVTLKQHNPEEEFDIDAKRIESIFLIVSADFASM